MRVRIYGRVQGVWYRGWTEQQANKFGLFGWVRNRIDGSVEALICGNETDVRALIELFARGPANAVVEKIETEPAQGIAPRRFEVKPTV